MTFLMRYSEHHDGNRYALNIWNYITGTLISFFMLEDKTLVLHSDLLSVISGILNGIGFVAALIFIQLSIASEESSGGTTDGGSSSGGSGSTSNSGYTGSSSGNTSVAQTIVNAAYSQLGVPYVYGGTTAGVGFDCSGLVQYCHAVAGISLPRTSQAQGGCGIAVSDPQPGDLVCYGSHIGIYIGNGQMIHAPHTGDVVKIASVYGSPWYRRCW